MKPTVLIALARSLILRLEWVRAFFGFGFRSSRDRTMTSKADGARGAPSRTITAAETRKWLERLDASPNDSLCDGVAGRLTQIPWPSDPTSPAAGGCDETDQWWDFKAAIKAAKTLHA